MSSWALVKAVAAARYWECIDGTTMIRDGKEPSQQLSDVITSPQGDQSAAHSSSAFAPFVCRSATIAAIISAVPRKPKICSFLLCVTKVCVIVLFRRQKVHLFTAD